MQVALKLASKLAGMLIRNLCVCVCVWQNDNYGYKARKVMLAQRAAPKTVWQQIGQIFM